MSLQGMTVEKLSIYDAQCSSSYLVCLTIQRIWLEDFKAIRDEGGTAWKKPGSLNYYLELSTHANFHYSINNK